MPVRLTCGTRRTDGGGTDQGAAAVEFALLIPIFVMLTFGMLTAGLAFWHNIALTQAARDAARLGSTYPISNSPEPGEKTPAQWLDMVANVAAAEAGWSGLSDIDTDNGFICVAFVAGSEPADVSTDVRTFGRAGDLPAGVIPGTQCFDDGDRPDDRVQVRIHRDAEFSAIFVGTTWDLNTRSSIPYERS
jgi:hypothetical protein